MSDDLSGFSLLDLFRSELETHAATLSEGLLALEATAEPTPAQVEPLMRAAHSLKGAARIVDLEPAVRVAHAMEDCFVAIQEGRCRLQPRHIDLLLRGLDLLVRVGSGEAGEATEGEVVGTVAALVAIPSDGGPADDPAPPVLDEVPEGPVVAEPPDAAPAADEAPKAAPAAEEKAAPPEPADRVVRLTADSLTRLMSLAGESLVQSRQLRPFVDSLLALKRQQSSLLATLQAVQDRQAAAVSAAETELLNRARDQANRCALALGETMDQIEDFARRNEDLSARLHHEVLTSRMRPLADGIRGFPRTVRDIARKLGKQVRFVTAGEATGVDRDILDSLEAPLNHLIRNALDHALETPDERTAAGKPATGTIRLEAHHRAGMLQITLSDDGRGIDPVRLRARVVERGLATASMTEQLSEAELLEFLFLPGFSTKDKVTELSGRGVGLDVVQNTVRAVGGFVRVTSRVGEGTRFTLRLPITRSVIRALLVRVGGEPYAFPLNRIDRIHALPKSEIRALEGRQHFMMGDQAVGLVAASRVLGLPDEGGRVPDEVPVVVASDRGHRFGLTVDEFLGERDLEVRPLDARLGKVPNINSASVLEDGWPVLIFDVEDLVLSVDNLLSGRRGRRAEAADARPEARGARRVLVVDDSITVRELERQLLESAGYAVQVAVDGLDGWNAVRSGDFDLVISDVDMPRMDGIQLVTLIKQDPRLRSVPVVIVSYKDREEDRMRGLDAGANAYLTKGSFHDRTFLATVLDLVGEAAP